MRRLSPHAVLTDIRMPPGHHMEGIEAAHAIRASSPSTGVVVLSQHADESYALALFADGSAGLGYLLKDRIGDLEDIVHALREVCGGGSVVDPQIVDTLVRRRSAAGPASPLGTLSPRELDVLREMAAGKTNAGIEQALFLSTSTVEKHVNAIFTKLQPARDRRAPAGGRGAGVPAGATGARRGERGGAVASDPGAEGPALGHCVGAD